MLLLDFLSIRKIPLKEQSRLLPDDGLSLEEDEEDPEVEALTNKLRNEVRKDRDLHDKVSLYHQKAHE